MRLHLQELQRIVHVTECRTSSLQATHYPMNAASPRSYLYGNAVRHGGRNLLFGVGFEAWHSGMQTP